jgi:hypothetical protein
MAFALNCTACIGNWQLAVNYAGSTSQGGPALLANNAAALGGVPAASYARVDTANSFSRNQNITGNVTASGNASVSGSLVMAAGPRSADTCRPSSTRRFLRSLQPSARSCR